MTISEFNNDERRADERRERVLAILSENPEGMQSLVENIATRAQVTPVEVLAALPEGSAVMTGAEHFDAVWSELAGWGDVMFIVQTEDVVAEIVGSLPTGTEGYGWFNIHGDSPLGGHIRKDNCRSIAFVDRSAHGRRSCSIWFVNAAGFAMFKVFVHRDAQKQLLPDQLNRFEALRARF